MSMKNVHSDRVLQPTAKRRQDQNKPKHTTRSGHVQKPAKKHPVNSLKTRIRSIKRQLEHVEKLPADVRIERERELSGLEYDLQVANRARNKQDMIGKYHKVRFFERRKAERRIKRARKSAEENRTDIGLQTEAAEAEVDLNYTLYYPLDQPYRSLFAKNSSDSAGNASINGESTARGDTRMREMVRKSMANGTLEQLRRGDLTSDLTSQSVEEAGKRIRRGGELVKTTTPRRRPEDGLDDDSDSDESASGFFVKP